MPKPKKPPRIGLLSGTYYVFYHKNGRSQRQSLGTENLQKAKNIPQ